MRQCGRVPNLVKLRDAICHNFILCQRILGTDPPKRETLHILATPTPPISLFLLSSHIPFLSPPPVQTSPPPSHHVRDGHLSVELPNWDWIQLGESDSDAMVWYNSIGMVWFQWYGMILYYSNGMLLYGMAWFPWYGMVWFRSTGMVWYDSDAIVWYGLIAMVWYGSNALVWFDCNGMIATVLRSLAWWKSARRKNRTLSSASQECHCSLLPPWHLLRHMFCQ